MTFHMKNGQTICFHQLQYCFGCCLYCRSLEKLSENNGFFLILIKLVSNYLLSAPPRWLTHSTNFSWRSWVHLIRVLLESTAPVEAELPEVTDTLSLGECFSCWEEKFSRPSGELYELQLACPKITSHN